MRIGVNCFHLRAEIGGLKQYFQRLFRELLGSEDGNRYVFFYFDHNVPELGSDVHIGIAKLPTLQICLSFKHCHLHLHHAKIRFTLEASHSHAIDQLWQERVGLYEKESLFPIRDAAYQD